MRKARTNPFKQLFCRHEAMLVHIRDVHGDELLTLPRFTASIWKCPVCGKTLYRNYLGKDLIYIPNTDMGTVSDGYHTFNELYDHRAKLFAAICNDHKDIAWKSKLHDDGSMYDGMFIVGIDTPLGQATYHYNVNPYWELFNVKELHKAPKWDGHTPADAISRIGTLKWLKKKDSEIAGEVVKMLLLFCDDDDQISIKKCELDANIRSILEDFK